MSFETLSHTPDFELPGNAPNAPADLISLIEECHEGLHKVLISKMVRRGKYDSISTIICQDNPSKKTKPSASADDIADYCMMCMQYEVDKSDDPGKYRVQLLGPPGRGRFERSKHVDLTGGEGEARTASMMNEGELVEKQSEYISELHSQIVAMSETVHSMIKPLLEENKEMMKIVSDASKKQAEIEREKLRHELELKIHNDELKMEEHKEELKSERWRESIEMVKESGAVEGLMKALITRINGSDDDSDDDESNVKEENIEKNKEDIKRPVIGKKASKKLEKAKKFKKKSKKNSDKNTETNLSESTKKAIQSGSEMNEDQIEEVFQSSGLKKAEENPVTTMVEVLSMSIEENEQWEIIQETLSENQWSVFQNIMKSENDKNTKKLLRELYQMPGMKRLLRLESHLKEDQKKWVETLMKVGMKKPKKKKGS